MPRFTWRRAAFFASLASLAACGSAAGDGQTFPGSGGSSAGGAAGAGASAASGGGGSGGAGGSLALDSGAGAGGTAGAGGGAGSTGAETLCDGLDDDGNGIVDDVDKGKDGICDCLRIATLGVAGHSGQGSVFAAWLTSRSDFGVTDLAGQTLTPALLSTFQVIVSQNLQAIGRVYSTAEVDAVEAWVRAGGGLMTLIGYSDPSEIANANLLLARFGQSYGSQPILSKILFSTVPITQWVPHPVTQGVIRLGVDNGYAAQGGTPLASEQGFTLLTVSQPDLGHVAVWGDEWITYDSEWSGHPDYQVQLFWVNAIKWLTAPTVCQVPVPPNVH